MWFSKKIAVFFTLLFIVKLISSCGFTPLYSKSDDKKQIDNNLRIPKISGKEGFHLREELIRILGDSEQAPYLLILKIKTSKINEVITPSNEITSYRLIMTANYSIENMYGNTVVPEQKSVVRTGFSSASNSTGYSTQIAEEASKKRLAIKLADKISTRLSTSSERWLE